MEEGPSVWRVGQQRIQEINGSVDELMTRRRFLGGAVGVTTLFTLQSAGLLHNKLESLSEPDIAQDAVERFAIFEGDSCAVAQPCELVIRPAISEGVKSTPFTDTPPATTSTTLAAPPTTAVPETIPPPPPASAELPKPDTLKRPYEFILEHEEAIFGSFPYLRDLNVMFGTSANLYGHVERQLEHIAMLDREVQLDVEEFKNFNIDMSRAHDAFPEKGITQIKAVLWHWTARPVDVQSLINGLNSKGYGIQNYVHHDGTAYQLTPTNSHYQDHALGLSSFTAGIEIFSTDDLGDNIPLLSYTPASVKSALYVAAHIMNEVGLVASRKTLLGHHFADTVLINPYYDPLTGEFIHYEGFKPPSLRKHDAVQDLMDILIPKLQKLQADFALAA